MHSAKVLLILLTKGYVPPEGAKHAIVYHEGKVMLVIMLDDGILHVTLEDEDLERPPGDLFADVAILIGKHKDERRNAPLVPEGEKH